MKLKQPKSKIFGFCFILFTMIQIIGYQKVFAQGDWVDSDIDTSRAKIKVKNYKPTISGFIQFQTLWHFDSNGDGEILPWRFRVQRARLRAEGKVTKNISYQLEIDPRSPEIAGIMRDAYISMDYIPGHKIMLGQQKTQFGYENRISSTRLYFVNRTDVSDNLSRGITLRDIGIGLIGSIPINDKYRFEDALTLVNGAGMNVQYDNTKKKNFWGRIGVRSKSDDLLWRFGVSGAYGDIFEPADTFAETPAFIMDFSRLGADFEIEHKWFSMAAEYVSGWNKEPDGTTEALGYYCLIAGKTPWNIGPLARYENMDGEFIRWVFGAYYGEPTDRIRVLVNYEIRKVEADPEFPFGEDNRLYLWLQIRF